MATLIVWWRIPGMYRRTKARGARPAPPPKPIARGLHIGVFAWLLHSGTAFLVGQLVWLVLIADGEGGDTAPSNLRVVGSMVVASLAMAIVFPMFFRLIVAIDNRLDHDQSDPYKWRHAQVAFIGLFAMIAYMAIIDPNSTRRQFLSLAAPAVLLPATMAVAWRLVPHLGREYPDAGPSSLTH
ncbi:MAG: hypothetical protein AAGD33_17745 [Actinomycetota bacterium]